MWEWFRWCWKNSCVVCCVFVWVFIVWCCNFGLVVLVRFVIVVCLV